MKIIMEYMVEEGMIPVQKSNTKRINQPEENISGWKNMVNHRNARIKAGERVPVLDPFWLQSDHYKPVG